MDETIRISSINEELWNSVLQGFQKENIQQVLEVVNANGRVIGTICESSSGQCYINGYPDIDYISLQAAATALLRGEAGKE